MFAYVRSQRPDPPAKIANTNLAGILLFIELKKTPVFWVFYPGDHDSSQLLSTGGHEWLVSTMGRVGRWRIAEVPADMQVSRE